MESILNKVTHLSGILKTLLPIKEEYQQKLDKKFRLEFNYNSNHLEGNTLTYGETVLLLIFDETKGNHTLREYEEMKAHDVAFALIKEWAEDQEHPLTEAYIRNLNKVILVRPFWKDAITPDGQNTRRQIKVGDYKEYPNSVRLPNGEIFHYASPSDTPVRMGELMNWYRRQEEEATLHPVELAALFHYKFVCIHPFDDGNGRISRLLMNYVLLRNYLPPVIIKAADKRNYLQALHQADVGDIQAFINYITQQLLWSLEISIKAAKGENIDEPGDLDKKLLLLKKKMGGEPDVKGIQKKDSHAIRVIVENSIIPLAVAWENKLKEFDVFFFSREVVVMIDGHRVAGNDLGVLLTNECSVYLYPNLDKNILIQSLSLSCNPRGIHKIKKEMSLNGGKIEVFFYDNTYEILFSGSETTINKLYHQQLTSEEIDIIVDSVGTWLYNVVAQYI